MRNKNLSHTMKLRQQAEMRLSIQPMIPGYSIPENDNLNFIHELQVYRIELEMQNDELQKAKEKIDEIAEKYIELYDFAPMGYFTLNIEGKVIELNTFASKMLGNGHKISKNSQLGFFIQDEDKDTFNLFLNNLVNNRMTETCMVNMSLDHNLMKQVFLTGRITKDGERYLIGAIDITERMQLKKESIELHQFNDFFVGREIRMVELKKEINELLYQAGYEKKYPV